jgi:translation initiation factor IF-3
MPDDGQYKVGTEIRVATVRVIDRDGTQLGILTTEDALQRAAAQGLDLVEVNPRANPPVCKIMSFEQFRRTLPGATGKLN